MSHDREAFWDDAPVDITLEANFIWGIANKLRTAYMSDKYGDVIIPMTILRRFECALQRTKEAVVEKYKSDPSCPRQEMQRVSGYQFYNVSEFTLAEICNDPDHLADNFKAYLNAFSKNVREIFTELSMEERIRWMDKKGCLYSVVKAFSELDLSIETFDSIKMGYIFENLIGRFYQNVGAGQYYTGRDIIKMLVSVLLSEGCDDLSEDKKVITVCDQACGTGGMLSTAYSYIRHFNPSADVRLFGQEIMGQSYAVGLAEMLIKGQNADNFRQEDTFKEDCFPNVKMRFVIENPPFGTPWGGKDAKDGQEEEVKREYEKGMSGRWGAGLPDKGDSQLLFMQSAVAKMDDRQGRAAIIQNGSSLFTGEVSSGSSQVRRWLLEQDLIEAIIAMPPDLFYNTPIATYAWILSKNKRPERRGKVQLINAADICHKMRKPLGMKKNEFTREDRETITRLYTNFEENELCQIFDNTEFIYREYAVMQPMQRSYAITQERIETMLSNGALNSLYDEGKIYAWENATEELTAKEEKKLAQYKAAKPRYDAIVEHLRQNISETIWMSPREFAPVLNKALAGLAVEKKLMDKIADGLSTMDKNAEVQRDRKGHLIYDKASKDTETVPFKEDIESYMHREVLPHIPDAQWFWEENLGAKRPVIRTGAEIPFTRYFYKYQAPIPSEELERQFVELDKSVTARVTKLFEEVKYEA